MNDIQALIRRHVIDSILEVAEVPEDVLERVTVTPCSDPKLGDFTTNAALVCAKHARLRS